MSEDTSRAAATAAEPTAPPETVKVRRLTALLNSASALLLFGAACTVFVGATPALLRTLLARGRSVSVSTDADHLMPHPRSNRADEASGGVTRTPHGTFRHDRNDDPSPLGDADHPFAGDEPGAGEIPPDEEPEAAEEKRGSSVRLGLARKTLTLYAEPGGAGEALGTIEAGEQVVIIKEAGPWALVFQSGKMGWTKKSEIAVR
ncbi:MAG: SH3 domain-containing protein [Polyangiaceae bacterium]|nr:SH3 domain-containing protein [Polyangiaceae bacterium]